tara:strand:- start:227 stop:706 length:480 start_codon:yes stop_codon:yes gene_type:complete
MNLIPEIVSEIEGYLSLKERLYWSSVNKGYLKLINRTNLKSHISATTLSRYIEYNFPISNEITIREEIESFMGRNDFMTLMFLGDAILKENNIHTYTTTEWITSNRYYKVKNMVQSINIWGHGTRIIKNQKVCAVYRFRKLWASKKRKETSLTVKALIY